MSTDLTKEYLISDNNTKMSETNKNSIKTSSINNSTEKPTQPTEVVKAPQKNKKQIPICNICKEKLTKETYIRCPLCKQFFCKFCVEDWLMRMRNNRICPLCAKKWDDNFICNNLPLGFVVNTLKLRIYGLYSNDYEYETKNKSIHDTNESDEEDENHDEEEQEEKHEEEKHEEEEHDEEEHDEEHNEDKNHDEEHNETYRISRERLLNLILNADELSGDQESINLIKTMLLSDLLDN